MTPAPRTAQEDFWSGDFGNHYIGRNAETPAERAARRALFARILEHTGPIQSCLELGANIGLNLQAIAGLQNETALAALEINPTAFAHLQERPGVTATLGSISQHSAATLGVHDLVMTCGVMIHLAPELLPHTYDLMHACSQRYLLVNEYYNPAPVEVPYRGHTERLYKRDFAGELLDRHPGLALVAYGFSYHRDPSVCGDDMTWFLLKKQSAEPTAKQEA